MVTVSVGGGGKVEVSVVHQERIKTGAVTWASLPSSLTIKTIKRRGRDESVGEISNLNLTQPSSSYTSTYTLTGRDHEREHAPASGPNKRPAVCDQRGAKRGRGALCFCTVLLLKPLTTLPTSSFLHSIISTNMRGSEFPLNP